MIATATLALALALGQADSTRATAAAEKAAEAAQAAAEAASRAAAAAEKVVQAAAAAAAARPAEPAPATKPPPAAPPRAAWTGTAGMGFISFTGNSTSVVFNANAAAERKSEDWILAAKGTASYGQTRSPATGKYDTTAAAAGGFLRGDRRFTPATSAYLIGGIETDHVRSVEVRYTGELGAAIAWVDWTSGEQKALLRTDLGFRLAQEKRFAFYPEEERRHLPEAVLVAPRFGLALRYNLNKDVLFSDDAEVLPNVKGDSRVVVNNTAKIAAKLTGSFQLGVFFTVASDSRPAQGRKDADTQLGASIEYLF